MALSQSFRRIKKVYSKRQLTYQPSLPPHLKFQDDPLERLPAHVLLQIEPGKDDESLIPGEMAEAGGKESPSVPPFAVNSANGLPTAVVRGSFHRKAGIREFVDISNSFVIRTVEIKRETGQNIGFYITQGDGLKRTDGIYVSRISLGSTVDVNSLLHVGEEIIKVNGVDVTHLSLDDVVILMQNVAAKLILTVKIRASATILRNFSSRKAKPALLHHRQLPSERQPLTQYSHEIHNSSTTEQQVTDADIDLQETSHHSDKLVTLDEIECDNSVFDTITSSPNHQYKKQIYEADDQECPSEIQLVSSTHISTSQEETYSPLSSSPPTPPLSPPPNLSSSHGSPTSLSRSLSSSTFLVTHQLLQASLKLEPENSSFPLPPQPILVLPLTSQSAPQPVSVLPSTSQSAPQPVSVVPSTSQSAPQPVSVLPSISQSAPQPVSVLPSTSQSAPQPVSVLPSISQSAPQPVSVLPSISQSAPQPVSVLPSISQSAPQPVSVLPSISQSAPQPVSVLPSISQSAPQPIPCSPLLLIKQLSPNTPPVQMASTPHSLPPSPPSSPPPLLPTPILSQSPPTIPTVPTEPHSASAD